MAVFMIEIDPVITNNVTVRGMESLLYDLADTNTLHDGLTNALLELGVSSKVVDKIKLLHVSGKLDKVYAAINDEASVIVSYNQMNDTVTIICK